MATKARVAEGDEDEFQRAQQLAAGAPGAGLATAMGDIAHQGRGNADVEELQPGLQHGEEADQTIGFGTQMTEIHRLDQDADQQRIGLAGIVDQVLRNTDTFAGLVMGDSGPGSS